ncbi:ABC transporter ATP-binding protein [Amycolatopsis sp. SID8362]|uniref:ABC transporter ATP-binding protein n=1 Tax=Amycolatopsis sp. SID8362 TaxID=2690346 RepID=UPI0013720B4B|nr:ABC transporter ATP-binding protein [Amycolatopsis sp. SID8362]NBH03431.1 ATP-binding cassette domain-containing protein [Amycolatopsis sp. SID8362]NED40131.1 ABC transporter ATP-binding protein [Amycolatopsis sp. SID8362]
MTSLTVSGLTKAFGTTRVLDGIDLHVPAHGLTAVLGPSGCGKTTLLRIIAGFTDPDAGTIAFGADTVAGAGRPVPPQRRRVGFVPQEGALFPHLTVAANITFGLPRAARGDGARLRELLGLVDLDTAVAQRYPHELSGGQQQRVALARALAPSPAVVLLDEPFSSLDPGLREGTGRAVAAALRATGATAVLVTHDQGEALSLADQVAVMRAGRLVQLDTPAAIYRTPRDTRVASFVGDAVLLPADVRDGLASCVFGEVAVPDAHPGRAQLLVRPEQIRLAEASSAEGVAVEVEDISYYGHDASVRLRVAPDGPRVTARVAGDDLPEPGSRMKATVAGTCLAYPVGD